MKSLINILNETIVDKLHEQKEGPKRLDPLIDAEVIPDDEGNHYLDKTPDNGWKEFWLDWNGDDEWLDLPNFKQNEYRNKAEAAAGKEGKPRDKSDIKMSLTDKEFLVKYDKSRYDFRDDFRDEIVKSRAKAINKYKKYYSGFVPFQKIYKQALKQVTDNAGGRTYMNHVRLESDAHERAGEIVSGLKKTLSNMESVQSTLVHYNKNDITKANGSSYNAWGWVHPGAGGPQGVDVYNINLHNFTNPASLDTWRKKIYNTTYHEIGHNIAHIFDEYDIEAYTDIKSQGIFDDEALINRLIEATGGWREWDDETSETTQQKIADDFGMTIKKISGMLSNEYYVNRPAEDYARIQRLRDEFDVGDNTPDAEWWANQFQDKVKNGDITTGDVMQTRDLYIPKYGFPGSEEKEHEKQWDWKYVCGIQKFLWSQGIKGVGTIVRHDDEYWEGTKKGQEVCDGKYDTKTKEAVKKFYKDMISKSKTGTRTYITIPKSMLEYNGLSENPTSYGELWSIFANTLWWNGEKVHDIAALFSKSVWDSMQSTSVGSRTDENELELVIDWNWIVEAEEKFVYMDQYGDDVDYKVA